MSKEEWGTKRLCLECGARFYDLKKSKITCPKCETVFVPEPPIKSKRWQASATASASASAGADAVANAVPKPKAPAEPEEDLADDGADSDDNDEDSNDTLLADDDSEDDDLSDVVADKPTVGDS